MEALWLLDERGGVACPWQGRCKGCLIPLGTIINGLLRWLTFTSTETQLSALVCLCVCVCHPPACTADRHFVFSVPASLMDPPLSPSLLSTPGNLTCKPMRVTSEYALFKIPMDECGTHRVVSMNASGAMKDSSSTLKWFTRAHFKKA